MKKPAPKKATKPPIPEHKLDDRTDTAKDKRARYDRLKDVDL